MSDDCHQELREWRRKVVCVVEGRHAASSATVAAVLSRLAVRGRNIHILVSVVDGEGTNHSYTRASRLFNFKLFEVQGPLWTSDDDWPEDLRQRHVDII